MIREHGELTGRTRFRVGFRKCLVLQVEYRYWSSYSIAGTIDGGWVTSWRDAQPEDVLKYDAPISMSYTVKE